MSAIEITGHRGAKNEAPENTVAGFTYARRLGLTAVEFDVRLTKDHQLVVIHDATVDRTTDGTGAVAELTRAELAALDAGAALPGWPDRCPVPTLAEALDALDGIPTMLIELKPDTPERLERIARDTLALLDQRGIGHRAILTSFNPVALEIVHRLAPSQRRGLIGDWDTPDFFDTARRTGCMQADIRMATASADVVAQAQEAGLRTIGWPCNTDDALRTLLDWGVDAVTTDVPYVIVQALTAR
jgi:glycerophosphoryl diester phosphodiesterase